VCVCVCEGGAFFFVLVHKCEENLSQKTSELCEEHNRFVKDVCVCGQVIEELFVRDVPEDLTQTHTVAKYTIKIHSHYEKFWKIF